MKTGQHHSYQTKRRLSLRVRAFWCADERRKASERIRRRKAKREAVQLAAEARDGP